MTSLEEQIKSLKDENNSLVSQRQQLEKQKHALKKLSLFLSIQLKDIEFSEEQLRQIFPGPIIDQVIGQNTQKVIVDINDFSHLYI